MRHFLEQTQLGISGHDPKEEEDMRGVFMARGPGFQQTSGEVYPAIELVDVYQIFCHLLDIEPQDNDGVWERVNALLKSGNGARRGAFAQPDGLRGNCTCLDDPLRLNEVRR